MRDVEVASTVVEAIDKFKELEEFTTLLKKDYHNSYDVYSIWAKYRDLDYMFLVGELTNLIGEWLEADELNAFDPTPSFPPPGPSAKVVTRAESTPVEAP